MGFNPNVSLTRDEATQAAKETFVSPESSADILMRKESREKRAAERKNDFVTPWALDDSESDRAKCISSDGYLPGCF